MDGAGSMEDIPQERETLILDLSDIAIRDLPSLLNPQLRASLERVLEETVSQPVSFLGFQNAP